MEKPYTVKSAFRVGQRWLMPGGDPVYLTDAAAQYPLFRGWLVLAETTTKKQVTTDAAK